jgi:SRSO17 transposase
MIADYAPLVAPLARPPMPNPAPRGMERLADDLVAYHARFTPLFQFSEQWHAALLYLQGQLRHLERKTIKPLAPAAVGGSSQSSWDADAMLHAHQAYVGATLSDAEEGAFIIDGCVIPKQGTELVSVARQWYGPLDKRATCQASMVVCYASSRSYTPVNRRLYLPERWFTPADAARRRGCGTPPDVTFRAQSALAGAMVAGLWARGCLPARWALCDEGFGQDTTMLDRPTAQGLWYLAEVPHTTRIWRERRETGVPTGIGQGHPRTRVRVDAAAPAPVGVRGLSTTLPPMAWRRRLLSEGAKGPLVAEVACARMVAVRDRLSDPNVWVVLRCGLGPDAELKAFRSNAADVPEDTLAQRRAARWPVEGGIEEGKGEVSLDHYEERGCIGWHHHVTLNFLAHHFLVQGRLVPVPPQGTMVDAHNRAQFTGQPRLSGVLPLRLGRKSPAMTMHQVRALLQVVPPRPMLIPQRVIAVLRYTHRQNHNAYRSHRKRILRRLLDSS